MSKKKLLTTNRKPDCVTEVRMGNTILTVSGFFKVDTVKSKFVCKLPLGNKSLLHEMHCIS